MDVRKSIPVTFRCRLLIVAGYQEMRDILHPEDTLVIQSLSRLGQNNQGTTRVERIIE
ncbi:hypothetical protein ACUL41_17745 [Virgibacillus natechei]